MVLPECRRDLLQNRIIDEGAQELEVAFTRFVHAGQDRIDDLKARFTGDTAARNAVSRADAAVGVCRRLQRADHSRSDGDDASFFDCACPIKAAVGSGMNIGFVERQLSVERRISGRRNTGGVGKRGETDPTFAPSLQSTPVERKSG
jgi:hypothetical protein